MKLQTWVDIIDGKKQVHKKNEFEQCLNSLKDGRYIYTIEKVQNLRSLDQNNTLWGIPYMFFKNALEETGEFKDMSKMQVHEWCMVNCLPEDYKERIYELWQAQPDIINLKTGEAYKEPFRLTTTLMTTIDCMHYIENMQNLYTEYFSSGLDDFIPDPDPKLKKRFLKEKTEVRYNPLNRFMPCE